MMVMTDNNAFEFFDFSEEETEEAALNISTEGYDRDGRICACGHPMKRHSSYGGLSTCSPTRLVCPCKEARAVIETSDTRVFLRKTRGSGTLHALAQGLHAAQKAGHTVKWLIEMKCDKCGTQGQVRPVSVSQRGVIMEEATGYDKLLCVTCRENLA
jgi:hypothetical protein